MCDKDSAGFIADLADQIALRLRARGVPPDAATDAGVGAADDIRRMWGGVSVYIRKTDDAALDARAGEIYDAWRGEGFTRALCLRFGLSEQRVRQIVRRQRQERRQPGTVTALFTGTLCDVS